VFGWARRGTKRQQLGAAMQPGVNTSDATELVKRIDAAVPSYLEKVDQGMLVYPACMRKPADPDCDIRSVWAHTRLEAVRYLTMVPGRQIGLLVEPARQSEMFEAFLRKSPHESTVVEFTGAPADDFVLAIVAGLNWLNHCALLARVDHSRFSGTLRQFRKLAVAGQQWWSLEGAEARCLDMLKTAEKPPLMLYLVWRSYTLLSKEVASASLFGPSTERTIARRQQMLREELMTNPAEFDAALVELEETMSSFEAAQEPDDLLG
jgi:hypothetical protein